MRRHSAIVFAVLLAAGLPAGAAELSGTYNAVVDGVEYGLIFDEEGNMSVVEDYDATVVAQYEADGTEITITDLGGAGACQGDEATGVYNYTGGTDSLSFTRVQDACEQRVRMLDGNTFDLAPE